MTDFYLHGDDWGMVSFEADDNRFERGRLMTEAPAGKRVGPPPVALAERWITPVALEQVLGPDATPLGAVTSGGGSAREREPMTDGFAFAIPGGGVIYGCAATGVVTELHITHCPADSAELLHRLGTAFRLILCDSWRGEVVPLGRRSAVDAYLTKLDD